MGFDESENSSRSASPELDLKSNTEANVSQASSNFDFFKSISRDGYCVNEQTKPKLQPWRKLWSCPPPPTQDGELLVACPTNYDYGSSLGGY